VRADFSRREPDFRCALARPGEAATRPPGLQQAKSETLKDLLQHKPGQKHYRRVLRAYLEADAALQRAIIGVLQTGYRADLRHLDLHSRGSGPHSG
jgi:hypothetical protein